MPRNISSTNTSQSGGQILVNTFAAQINANDTGFLVYNSVSTSPLFKIDTSALTATFYCDLNVIGSATFTSVANIAVTSSMMSLATGNTVSNLIDIGFYGLYTSSGAKYRGLVHSISLGRWILFKDITTVPGTTITLSGSYRDTLEVQDIYYNGDGSTLSALKTSMGLFPTELQNLTTTEIQQLENIGANTISATQWGYISNSNQRTDTAGTPSFSGLTLSTGVMRLPAGTAGAPVINLSDTTTGLYRPGANQIAIAISGVNVGTWSSTGLAMNTLAISGVSTISATTLGGTLSTAAQANITSLGTLTGLTMGGALNLNSQNIINGATITATTLAGTLSTATQNSVTTMTGLTTVGAAGTALAINGNIITMGTNIKSTGYISNAGNIVASGATANTTPTIDSVNDRAIQVMSISAATGSQITCANSTLARFISLWSGRTVDPNPVILYSDALRFGSCTSPNTAGYAETMRIMSGNLLIGTDTNASSRKLLVNGSIEGTNIYGTLGSATQTSITSLGTLTGLTVNGNLSITGTGVMSLPAGTVGTPAINLSDTTTGLYRAGANQIGIAVSGAFVGIWTSTGLAMNALPIIGVSTLTATTLGGTLSTATQPNVTRLGSLTSLSVNGTVAITGTTRITGTISQNGSIIAAGGFFTGPFMDVNSDRGIGCVSASGTTCSQITAAGEGWTRFISLWSGRVGDDNPIILYSYALRFGSCTDPSTTGYAETMRISSGNLLIGTATNASSRKLLVSGDIEGTNIYGTLGSATQANITRVGTLSSLTVGGNVTVNPAYTIQTNGTATTGFIIPHQYFANSGTNRFGFALTNAPNDFSMFGYDTGTSAYTRFISCYRTTGSLRVQIEQALNLSNVDDNVNGNITSGGFIPTYTNVSKMSTFIHISGMYLRVGYCYNVQGSFTAVCNGVGSPYQCTLTLPVSGNVGIMSGVVNVSGLIAANFEGFIVVSSNLMQVNINCSSNLSGQILTFYYSAMIC